ncbi:hypothetical protein I3760_05G223000 [Carya illinoinensis]|nr:hypothetical protein I3760_05G223000 [Carya illinoinensis]
MDFWRGLVPYEAATPGHTRMHGWFFLRKMMNRNFYFVGATVAFQELDTQEFEADGWCRGSLIRIGGRVAGHLKTCGTGLTRIPESPYLRIFSYSCPSTLSHWQYGSSVTMPKLMGQA